MLAATKLQNERLRITGAELAKLLAKELPYTWQQSLIVSLGEFTVTDKEWCNHSLAKAVW